MKNQEINQYPELLFAAAVMLAVIIGGAILIFHETRIKASCTIDNITWTRDNFCSFMGDTSCPKPQSVSCEIEAPMIFFRGLAT